MEGEAAIEIRIHYKHRQPQPYSCQPSQSGYDYPQSSYGHQTVWFHGATPRPQAVMPVTGGPTMRVGGVGVPEGALDTHTRGGQTSSSGVGSLENSTVQSLSGYHSARDSLLSLTDVSSPRGSSIGGQKYPEVIQVSARSMSSSCEKALDADTIVEKEESALFPPRSLLSYLSSDTHSVAADLSPRSVSDPVAVPVEVQVAGHLEGASWTFIDTELTSASSTDEISNKFSDVSSDKAAEAAADLLLATMNQSKLHEIASIGQSRSSGSPLGYLSTPRRKGLPLPAVVEETPPQPQPTVLEEPPTQQQEQSEPDPSVVFLDS